MGDEILNAYYHILPILFLTIYPFLHNRVITFINLCVFPIYFGLINSKIPVGQTRLKKALAFVWILVFFGVAYVLEYRLFVSDNSIDSEGVLLFCLFYKISVCISMGIYFWLKGFTKSTFLIISSLCALYSCIAMLLHIFDECSLMKFFEMFFLLNDFSIVFLLISIFTILWCIIVKINRDYLFKTCLVINLLNVLLWLIVFYTNELGIIH